MEKGQIRFPVVGIGASAGGTESVISFFEHMPADTSMAYIVVRHLKREYKSHFESILQKKTTLKVITLNDKTEIKRGHIYLMPENTKVKVEGSFLRIVARPQDEMINDCINFFFKSLAVEAKEMAVGIVLSGMLQDGAEGAIAIKANGGTVLVEHPLYAKNPEMPVSTIMKDHPDFVLPVEEIPTTLVDYMRMKTSQENLLYKKR